MSFLDQVCIRCCEVSEINHKSECSQEFTEEPPNGCPAHGGGDTRRHCCLEPSTRSLKAASAELCLPHNNGATGCDV